MIAKRVFDLILVIPGLLLLLPILLLISLAIRVDSQGPVFFRQERVGRGGILFKIYKFRTMIPNAETLGARVTVGQDPRITRIGHILRKYKLDELPQLLNVFMGDMSLVGPRPEVPEYVAHYTESDKKLVHSLLPGITDPASIEFRNESELLSEADDPEYEYINNILPRKIYLYREYVANRSLVIDLKIILNTIRAIGKG